MSQVAEQSEQYGVTPPISRDGPSAQEIALAADLMNELKGTFESADEGRLREAVLGRVTKHVKEFIYQACIRRNLSEQAARNAGGKIYTFGSYRLGVHGPGSDIDTLVVAPKHVDRQDFMDIFLEILKKDEWVEEANPVPEAYVPVIDAKIKGISMDFTFARLALSVIPDDLDLGDDSILKNLDEKCVRSLNGSRSTDAVLRLVPNVHVFRDALRAIKYWAQRRAIYSNVSGFLGGVAWALLVARVCQLYPNGNSATIVRRFFLIMSMWKWPQPVVLRKIEDGYLHMRVWNPKIYPSDKAHRMPIITPAYPSMCSTHNVMNCTFEIMQEELKRGHDICLRISNNEAKWSELFEKHKFFSKYHYYLQIITSCDDAEIQKKWSKTVESKGRQLVNKLEESGTLARIHPFVKGFNKTYYTINREEHANIVLGNVSPEVANRTEEEANQVQSDGRQTIHTTTFYIGMEITRLDPSAATPGPRRLDISIPTSEFIKTARSWELYQPEIMGIAVRHIKNSALPEDVFEGEGRPRKAVKRSKAVKATPESGEVQTNKRRRPSDEVSSPPLPVDPNSLVPSVLPPIPASEFAQPGPPKTPVPPQVNNGVRSEPNGASATQVGPATAPQLPITNGHAQPQPQAP
ncbi:polynucleotide adenylyltransferase [Serendipita sp. 396]|nr:polynucleotide adenylyltransferase [Serendipita sp. 396]KAG8786687.1 polynucleotide adenylyltransferase [Serendipita sp. 397]KAG8825709.1 polynucleotide adenylyltransferase [Serendipita sp. 401]KAG8835495.1 polynucleotide adenylyltransferase [Serendipita sp. 400]KAG8871264.1 polynucleotide adenylyltransferase [Serendipita sp. 405]KAG9056285.1 polynucleotide adenylyltransferase [Serendipita sp. 407]